MKLNQTRCYLTIFFLQKNCNIEDVVFQQLCDFDMCEIGSSSLPKIVMANESGFIEGIFLCQISFLVDSTESYFTKIQNILGKINENALVDADDVPGATQVFFFLTKLF